MPVEEILHEIERENQKIAESNARIRKLSAEMMSNENLGYDWISVKKAAEMLGVSMCVIYNKINTGKLNVKHIESKKFVLLSEIKAIDDKYNG